LGRDLQAVAAKQGGGTGKLMARHDPMVDRILDLVNM
jgi:hypothetical protein